MRRLLTFVVLILSSLPIGISVAGCSKGVSVTYCNGGDTGPVVGQVSTIDIEPRATGISLNQGQIGSISTPAAKDCKNNSATVTAYTYGSSNVGLVDVEPSNGRVCAGTWNRNTGGGIADYTVCTGSSNSGVAYVTASAGTATSNALPVFVHPTVTSIVLGPASTNCFTDPASNCIPPYPGTPSAPPPPRFPVSATAYTGAACVSQGQAAQLVARTYSGSGSALTNISCQVGPLTFTASNPTSGTDATSVVTIDQNGVATAAQPGSALINANIAQSSSTTGFFATCPPKSIVLTAAGSTAAPTSPINITQNVQQDLVATVTDTNGNPITNVTLSYQSTVPQTIAVAGSIITPVFPGAASITATCQPPTCNTSPFNQIGLFGNGLPVTSNNVQVNATGTGNSTVLYIASSNSLYVQPYDFTVTTQPAPTRLPYAPNSFVISEDLSTIYMGNANEIMVYSTLSNALTSQITAISGTVLAISNDNSTIVVTDPVRQLVYLYLTSGNVLTEYGGVGTHAQFSPDSQTVYITTTDGRLLTHSSFTGWNAETLTTQGTDVAVTVPHAGAYLGGTPVRGYTDCPATTTSGTGGNQTTTNVFYPLADTTTAVADRLAATNDGAHILGASAAAGTLTDIQVSAKTGACPVSFASTTNTPLKFTAAVPSAITGILPTSDSTFALVTYTGTGSVVPQYTPASKTLVNVALVKSASGVTPTAPISGVISSDNNTAYIGTSGDNLVHLLSRSLTGFTDVNTPLTPALPGVNGGVAAPNFIVQKPRKGTN